MVCASSPDNESSRGTAAVLNGFTIPAGLRELSMRELRASFIDAYDFVVLQKPVLTLLTLAGVLLCAVWFARDFELDVSPDSLVLEHDADLKYYRAISARYGSDDYLIVTYSPHADLFARETLADLQSLRDELAGLARVATIVSILDVPLLQSPPITVDQLADGWRTLRDPATEIDLARAELRESPLYSNRLVSPDGGTTALQVIFHHDVRLAALREQRDRLREKRLSADLSSDESQTLANVTREYQRHSNWLAQREARDIAQVREILRRYRDRAQVHLGGLPMITVDMMRFIRHDLVVFGLAVLGVLAVLLSAFFRELRWVVLPLITAFVTTVVAVGLLGLLRWRLTVVSSNFIALLLIFSLSLSIHLIVRYRELRAANPHQSQRWLVRETVHSKAAPSFYTVLTTMIAFGSLVVSGIRPVIDFGWIMVLGLAIAFGFVFTLLPASLMVLKRSPLALRRQLTREITAWLGKQAEMHGNVIMIVALVVVVLSVFGITRLSVENRFIDYFHESTEIYQGMRLIDEKLGGTTPLDVIIDPPAAEQSTEVDGEFDDLLDDAEGGITTTSYWFNSQRLDDVAALHAYLESLPESGKVLSLSTGLQALEALATEGQTSDDLFLSLLYKRLPVEIKQQLIDPFLSQDGDQLRLAMRVYESDYSLQRQALIEKIRAHLTDSFALADDQIHITGMLVLYNNLLRSLFRSQILTLGAVFAVILLMFALVFRSVRVAAAAIIPNIIAAAVVLGLLGALGIPLDIMTITIAAITIGIAVDDTIHYVHRYRVEWLRDRSYVGAIHRSHASIGLAMYYTTTAVTIGFAVLALSNFRPTIYFGLFTALAMIAALIANIVLLPVLLQRLRVYGTTLP